MKRHDRKLLILTIYRLVRKKQDILEAIRDHPVVIVAGETGSGKTTQLPKICMELGRGIKGLIGHTQPRRPAARTVANRIAEELKTEPGGCIGYKVRFSDHVSDNTMVKLMTDGIPAGGDPARPPADAVRHHHY
ncbi:hypothetical protein ACP0HM_04720 [Escherichia coli]